MTRSRDAGEELEWLRAQVAERLRTRRFLDYRESAGWADLAAPVVQAIREVAEESPSRQLVLLIQGAIDSLVKVMLNADDSDGVIGELTRDLLDLHAVVCDSTDVVPTQLARWMIRFGFDDQDFFVVDPVRYADALGERGLTAFRDEVQRRRGCGATSFGVTYATERLAVLDRDLDQIVILLGGDLSHPYQFIRVAEAMEELRNDDLVLDWALRGIEETDGWQVTRLYDLAVAAHVRRGDAAEQLRLRQEQYERMPSPATYGLLRKATDPKHWEEVRAGVRETLGSIDRGGLVDVLLSDGEPDAAWTLAMSDPHWDPGPQRWLRLAKAREAASPADAFNVYLSLADLALETAGRATYARAIGLLRRARGAATLAGSQEAFRLHLASLREQYRRRPAFLEMLDRASLS